MGRMAQDKFAPARRDFQNDSGHERESVECGASGFFGHRFGVKRVIQTGVADVEES
jgi:hypothetical protein